MKSMMLFPLLFFAVVSSIGQELNIKKQSAGVYSFAATNLIQGKLYRAHHSAGLNSWTQKFLFVGNTNGFSTNLISTVPMQFYRTETSPIVITNIEAGSFVPYPAPTTNRPVMWQAVVDLNQNDIPNNNISINGTNWIIYVHIGNTYEIRTTVAYTNCPIFPVSSEVLLN